MTIKILIADDHVIVRRGLKQIVEETTDIIIVGEAANGGEVLRQSGEKSFDLLEMDQFSMPRLAGLLCGLLGVALIALPSTSLPDAAMIAYLPIAMVGPFFYAFEGNFVAKYGTAGMDAVQAMFLASCVGAVIIFPVVLWSGQWIDPFVPWGRAEIAFVLESVVHTLCYCTYVWLAARAGAVFATQTSYIVTGTGVIWAMLLLGERFSPWVWAALGVMLLGLFLVQPRKSLANAA